MLRTLRSFDRGFLFGYSEPSLLFRILLAQSSGFSYYESEGTRKCAISKSNNMGTNNYTAVVKQDGDWWIGWIEEVQGVNCQEGSREELLESLRVTLNEALENFIR